MGLFDRTSPPLGRWPGDPEVVQRGPSGRPAIDRVARGLGWLTLGLGLLELLSPRRISRPLGLSGREGWVRAFGARELASGAALLAADPRFGMWSRVGGDLVDLGALGAASRRARRPVRRNVAIASAVVSGALLLDTLCALALERRHGRRGAAPDYGDRVGMPRSPDAMRGAAREFATPRGQRASRPSGASPQPAA